ncbi:MAG: 50S ribosomal protein L35 [Acidobacteria bacterium]|nr:50S ribosomal protein L35 [Acidobacteriota bacterium]
MPKLKTHRGMAKRVKRTARGKLLRHQAHLRHLLTGKRRKRKRALRQTVLVGEADLAQSRRLLPYWKKM